MTKAEALAAIKALREQMAGSTEIPDEVLQHLRQAEAALEPAAEAAA